MNYFFVGGRNRMPQECSGVMHVIRRGDSLYKLSRIYGVTLESIMDANPNVNVYNMQVGSTVCIPIPVEIPNPNSQSTSRPQPTPMPMPQPTPTPMPQPTPMPEPTPMPQPTPMPMPQRPGGQHQVEAGETLNSILDRFGMDFDTFAMYNPELMPIPLNEGIIVYVADDRDM